MHFPLDRFFSLDYIAPSDSGIVIRQAAGNITPVITAKSIDATRRDSKRHRGGSLLLPVAVAPSAVGEGQRKAGGRKRPGRYAQGGFFFFRVRIPLLRETRQVKI
jgi:hypothetical protein